MIAAGLSSLNARIFLFERRRFGVDGESDDALGGFVRSDAPEELEPARVVLGIEDPVRTLVVIDHLILREGDFSFVTASQDLAGAFAVRANQSRLRAGVQFIEIAIVHPSVPFQIRHRALDLCFHLELTEHVQSEIIAAYRHFVAGRWENQLRRVIEQATCS